MIRDIQVGGNYRQMTSESINLGKYKGKVTCVYFIALKVILFLFIFYNLSIQHRIMEST